MSYTSPVGVRKRDKLKEKLGRVRRIFPPTSNAGLAIPGPSSVNTVALRGLWSEAFNKLSAEEQEATRCVLGTQQPLSKTSIDELLDSTRILQKECEEKSFKFHFNGKEIIMRDVAGKIFFWLSKFKEVGDIAVNFDPVHASLPWAGVRFLLQAVISEHEQMGDLIIAIEKLSCLIHRGAIYERLYKPEIMPTHAVSLHDPINNLHDAMVELYVVILRVMSLCHRLLAKNTTKRAVHALFNPADISEFIKKCKDLEEKVEYEAQNCERTRSQEVDAEHNRLLMILQAPILQTDEGVLRLLEKTEDRECLEILDWMSGVLYGENHETVKEKRTADTCQWILDHSRYKEWQDTSASIVLWLCGNPGSGKTFLTSKVVDEVQGALKSKPNQEGFAFFYCNRNEAERRTPLSVLRAFVRQLSTIASEKQSMQKSLKQFYKETRRKASQPTTSDCKNLLLEFINIYPRTTLVLDALDECERDNRLDLIEVFDELLIKALNPLKILISSRPDIDIKRKLKNRANIEIQAKDNHKDITRFVNSQISQHSRWGLMERGLQERIVGTLQSRSEGMFQWAFLQIKQLLDLDLEEDILERLGKLPSDLKQAYDEIYNAMSKAEKRIADRAFQWVICARKPLTTRELLPAICQDENSDILKPLGGLDEDLVLKYCHNLLVIDPVREVWVPSHLSVIEYFEENLWNQNQANCLVLSVCLSLLQNTLLYEREKMWGGEIKGYFSQEGNELKDPLDGQDFKGLSVYARHNWPIHARRIVSIDNNTRISTRLEEFLGLPVESSAAYRCWHRMTSEDALSSSSIFKEYDSEDFTPASIAGFAYCAFGLAILLPNWHDLNWIKYDNRNKRGRTFLELAVTSGSILTCRDVIKHGAEVNAQTKSAYGSALATAACTGQKEVVEYLVREGGAEVNLQLREYGSALAAAAWGGETEVVEFLVREGGAEVNLQLGEYGSALAAAAWVGKKEVVEFLVREGGAEVNLQLQYGEYGSALAAAVSGGREDIVEFLLREGAEVNLQLQHGTFGTALDYAEAAGQSEIAQLLIKYGAKRGEPHNTTVEEEESNKKETMIDLIVGAKAE